MWTRTRTCLSGDLNCPCSGDTIDSTYTCPCIPVTVINSTTTCSSTTAKQPFFVRTPYYNPSKCVAAFVAEASNYRHTFFTASGSNFLTTIGWVDSTGTCQAADVKGLGGLGTAGTFYKLEFPCNLTTGRFGGVVDGNNGLLPDLICEMIMGSENVTTGSSGPRAKGYTPEIEQICKEATQDQCRFSIRNRPIYAKYCPNTCGFCTMNSCIDAVSVCDKDPLICTAPELKEFAEKYCQRSCGICTK
ncbi:hypothetical protein CAEBREN_16892 [Caenorhabditis brenneri]|uniref:ShKT domain-containing protein n=1 Tax=Caenorhabditis brenneri TaxID=135651 RepID=G0NCA6_CAEBE|nr:hypothetical protein CAEBREN_16892 [Caenorhabditis brenneri]